MTTDVTEQRTPDEHIWTAYTDMRPEHAGPYKWRVPSQACKGLTVQFVAQMRERPAGFRQELSPSFDYWNGSYLQVPPGLEWTTTEVICQRHETVGLSLPGVDLLPCPFCRVVPFWHAVEGCRDGGVMVGGKPHLLNSWWLECCSWVKTPHVSDPRELAKRRNAVIRGETYV